MALVPMRLLLDHAAENDFGIPAFNINNLEQVIAIMQAADAVDSPVIIQASRGARSYAGEAFLRHLILGAVESYPHIPIAMHLDHGNEPATCYTAMCNGFSSVMMDGSLESDAKSPASYEYNCTVTREVVEVAHSMGVSVEGELGCLGSLETSQGDKDNDHGGEGVLSHGTLLTDPDQAEEFVDKTGVDALAVAIGTSHGAYKFTKKPEGETLRMDLIIELHRRLPNTHIVMHGSSSVPAELVNLVNDNGGEIINAYGVPVEEIQLGIKHGVRKINIDTDLRLASTGAVRRFLATNPSEFDPRKYLKETITAMKDISMSRYEAFGTAGNASKIKPVSLETMFERYETGELDPRVQ